MTTIQAILSLQHVYEPAVQLCRTDSVPHVSIRDDLGPQTAVCTHCKAQHWELGATVFRVFGRLYHRLGALIPAVNRRPAFAQTWLIDPAEATDTRLQGPDSAETRIQRSTQTKLKSMLRTGNRFVREFASVKARAGWDTAKEWVLPGRDRRTHNLPTSSTEMAMLICDSDTNTGDRAPQDLILQVHGDRCPDGRPKYQIVSSLHSSAMPLRYPLLFPAGEDGFHPNIPLCGFNQAGPPIARNREQIDNGIQPREVLAGLGLDDGGEEEDEDRGDEDEDGEEGDEEDGDGERTRLRLFLGCSILLKAQAQTDIGGESRVTILCALLAKRDEYFSIPHCTQHRSTQHIRLHQENLRLTTTQGINGLTPNQIGRSMIKNRPRDITQRYQDAMACVVKHGKPPLLITVTYVPESPKIKAALGPNDKARNRPDLIAQLFEVNPATSDMQAVLAMNVGGVYFVSLLYFVWYFLNICAEMQTVNYPAICISSSR
ncbi:BQ5605_C004g03124 [Microbotryum silenes-dioicae]|uniref:BQ5605_C004g03124 protein n=1 Tax=Microbotryum silenes-dioicae TaxID=796604 RepID=A0A2X0N3U9_9BASI|nr:BQ5605_C004g03124 [Microbotryum silenes-dioicae]